MQLQKLVNMFGGDLARRYGEKVYKLTPHGGFSCPKRDGTLGRGGCIFCNVGFFADEAQQHRSKLPFSLPNGRSALTALSDISPIFRLTPEYLGGSAGHARYVPAGAKLGQQ